MPEPSVFRSDDVMPEIARPVVVAEVMLSLPPPTALSAPPIVVEPVIASEPDEVAWPKSVLPKSVVEARKLAETELKAPAMVDEALTAKLPVVVPLRCWKSRPVKRPVFDMERSVVLAPLLDVEPMAKAVVVAEVEARCRERNAHGVVEAPTTAPFQKLAAENWEVDEAKMPAVALMTEEVAAVIWPKLVEKTKLLACPADV